MQFRHRTSRTRRVRTAVVAVGAVLGTAALTLSAAAAVGQSSASAAKVFPHGTVHADGGLTARQAPSTHAPATYAYDDGAEITVNCKTKGTQVSGNRDWYLVSAEGDAKWVSGRYVKLDGEAAHCGPDVTVSAKATRTTDKYEGPSTSDRKLGRLDKGRGTEVLCYTYSGPASNENRWLVTLDAEWIPAEALKPAEEVPFCEQA
ncbi:hypothetical protein HUT18_14470 [Streptomyces sp. NA04227]|uniref:hypothetical protein n=1 Tax=Streptomyces sp. NA04227 TaxID=2742136 RepID=UPI0015904F9D|nr:hypothetical protein [Streptomyces sp. NA04227]QKW07411.1 hypothetical protein HUT18_14470 [Streptomyces sp. NA04227]